MVVNVHGAPVAHAMVVAQGRRESAAAETDERGRFTIGPLGGGPCWLGVGTDGRLARLWANRTAPPAATQTVLIVLSGEVVRGQLPLQDFCESNTFVVCGLMAAMIAIPVAVHTKSAPVSPP